MDLAPADLLDRLRREYPEAVFLSALDPSQADRIETRVRAALRASRAAGPTAPVARSLAPVWALGRGGDS